MKFMPERLRQLSFPNNVIVSLRCKEQQKINLVFYLLFANRNYSLSRAKSDDPNFQWQKRATKNLKFPTTKKAINHGLFGVTILKAPALSDDPGPPRSWHFTALRGPACSTYFLTWLL